MFLIALLGIAPALRAQKSGVLEGRLINGTDPEIACAGAEVDILSLGGGLTVLKSTETDASGRFRVEGLPVGAQLMIRTTYQSANYHARFDIDATGKAYAEVEVFEPTTSMKGIRMEDVRLGYQLDGDHLRVLETYSFVNETKPRRTFTSSDGGLRFSKPAGIRQLPRMSVRGPGSSMPLAQSPLESADGQSYYSLYPLRPGTTTFEVDYTLPYHERTYTYRKRFYHDVEFFQVGVIPQDMNVGGEGLKRIQPDASRNFAVYSGGPVKAGAELAWTFSGGTPIVAAETAEGSAEPRIRPVPNSVGRYALVAGPLLLMAFIIVLWYAYNNIPAKQQKGQDRRARELKTRRDHLLNFIAALDQRHEEKELEAREYHRLRSQAKSQLRRIAMLLSRDHRTEPRP